MSQRLTRLSVSRRQFLQGSLAAAAMAGLLPGRSIPELLAAETSASELVDGKSRSLIVLETQPIVLETPLAALAKQTVTPLDILFVRNNQDTPTGSTLKAVSLEDWQIEVSGLFTG